MQTDLTEPGTVTEAACPVCGGAGSQQLYNFQPARWIPGTVVRCTACRTVYKVRADPSKRLADYYDTTYAESDYWDREQATVRALKKIRDVIVDTLGSPAASLLDVGCGPGVFLSLAQEAGFSVTGLELNSVLAQRARQRTGAEVIVGDFMSVRLDDEQFDVITLLDLIEHLPNPVSALRRCHELLKPGGCLVVYTPNHRSLIVRVADLLYRLTLGKAAGPVAEIFDCSHVVFFDVQTLGLALGVAGFQVTDTVLLKYDPSRSNQATGLSALALRGIEAVSPVVKGQFRILMCGKKP
jgi:2-polyprenyl-3-methyl-5-hydroxy-6-metoxy-1,4-benzoquinol methylase